MLWFNLEILILAYAATKWSGVLCHCYRLVSALFPRSVPPHMENHWLCELIISFRTSSSFVNRSQDVDVAVNPPGSIT